VKQNFQLFAGGLVIAACVLAAASYVANGASGAICALIAIMLCAAPAIVSMKLAMWGASRSPSQQLMAVFGGMGIRMVAVLGIGLAMFLLNDWFRAEKQREYVYWGNILVSYLITLGLETFLIVRTQRGASEPAKLDAGGASEVRN